MAVQRVTDRDFKKQVLDHETPVLVIFTAAFCDASQRLLPMVEDLSAAFRGRAKVVNLDLGTSPVEARKNRVVQRYKVSRLPLVMLFGEGRVKDFIGGVPGQDDLHAMIERQLQPVLDVGEHNFQQEVLEAKVPVLVHFHSRSCEQSRHLGPIVEEIGKRFRGRAKVVRVEAEAFNAGLCARYGAIRFPMLASFEGGEMRDCILGVVDDATLRAAKEPRGAVDHVADMLEQLV
jgi:thioredoxin 1